MKRFELFCALLHLLNDEAALSYKRYPLTIFVMIISVINYGNIFKCKQY